MKKVLAWIGIPLLVIGLAACNSAEDDTKQEAQVTENAVELMVTADTVDAAACVLDSRFTVGERIVWRADVVDPVTGEQVVDADVVVKLSTGDELEMVYGQHPPETDGAPYFWTAAWTVTEDTPTGIIEYSIEAKHGDKVGLYEPFDVSLSKITIVDPELEAEGEAEKGATNEDVETTNQIDLIGRNFEFKDKDGNQTFYVKQGEEVTITLESEEGVHGIAVMGMDDVEIEHPGGEVTFTPTEAGEFEIVCNIFCGEGHNDMTATIVVVA